MSELSKRIDRELMEFRLPAARERLQKLLQEPREQVLRCPHREVAVEVLIVARLSEAQSLVFADGKTEPWGLVYTENHYLGTDDFWFLTLEDAFYSSQAWGDERPPDYEVS